MKRHSRTTTIWLVVLFCVLVNALAWLGPVLGGGPTEPGPGFLLWATAPLLVALLLRTVTRDWSDFGLRPGLRRHLRWYALSALAFPAAMAVALLGGTLLSASTVKGFDAGRYLPVVAGALVFFLIFAVFEEVGWRGYLAPKLSSLGLDGYLGHGLVGVVWAGWHLPYVTDLTWIFTGEALTTFVPRFFLAMCVLAIVYGEIRLVTGTFWPAVVMHGVGNAVGHPLTAEYLHVVPGREYLGSIGDGLLAVAVMALLGTVLHRRRTSEPARPATSPG